MTGAGIEFATSMCLRSGGTVSVLLNFLNASMLYYNLNQPFVQTTTIKSDLHPAITLSNIKLDKTKKNYNLSTVDTKFTFSCDNHKNIYFCHAKNTEKYNTIKQFSFYIHQNKKINLKEYSIFKYTDTESKNNRQQKTNNRNMIWWTKNFKIFLSLKTDRSVKVKKQTDQLPELVH